MAKNIISYRNGVKLALGLLIMLSVGCNSQQKDQRRYFRYNEQAGISSLDPAMARNQANMWPVHQLYNTLVEVDDSLRIVPSLALSWEVSEDRLRYTFHLRRDVFFS